MLGTMDSQKMDIELLNLRLIELPEEIQKNIFEYVELLYLKYAIHDGDISLQIEDNDDKLTEDDKRELKRRVENSIQKPEDLLTPEQIKIRFKEKYGQEIQI